MMHKSSIVFWTSWVTLVTSIFLGGFFKQMMDPELSIVNRLGSSLYVSRGAGMALGVLASLMLLAMCRNTMGLLKRTPLGALIPFDDAVFFHKVCAWTVLFLTIVHTNAHYINFFKIELKMPSVGLTAFQLHYMSWAGATGHIMLLVMFLLYTAAASQMRAQSFEAFWIVHHLAAIWYLCLYFHGFGCVVHSNRGGKCASYYSWAYNLAVGLIYLGERILRVYRGEQYTEIVSAVLHPGNALELRFVKPSMSYQPGQYLFANIPEVSQLQWHPFTITSCPEEQFISVHIRLVGDWTNKAARVLGCKDLKRDLRNIKLRIDGPYSAPADRVFEFDYAILVGAGIGVTPFASILKSMYCKVLQGKWLRLRKVDFFWVNRDKRAFEWFQEELRGIESMLPSHLIDYHLHLTERLDLNAIHNYCLHSDAELDPITELHAQLQFGRPNWEKEFVKIRDAAIAHTVGGASSKQIRIACFFCGPGPLASTLNDACAQASNACVSFHFFMEHF